MTHKAVDNIEKAAIITSSFFFRFKDFKLINYDPDPHIKGDVAV